MPLHHLNGSIWNPLEPLGPAKRWKPCTRSAHRIQSRYFSMEETEEHEEYSGGNSKLRVYIGCWRIISRGWLRWGRRAKQSRVTQKTPRSSLWLLSQEKGTFVIWLEGSDWLCESRSNAKEALVRNAANIIWNVRIIRNRGKDLWKRTASILRSWRRVQDSWKQDLLTVRLKHT